jgi:hypothetical protein
MTSRASYAESTRRGKEAMLTPGNREAIATRLTGNAFLCENA